MNLDELQSVQSRERQTDSLQQLRESFYEDAGEYIQQLRDERDAAAERAEDPFDSPEVNRLSDDIKTSEQAVEALYERRVGKVVKMASLAAADMPTDDEGLTHEEAALFETLVTAIEENREHVLDVLAGEASPGAVNSRDEPSRSEAREESTAAGEQTTEEANAAGETTDGESTGVGAADVMGGTDSGAAEEAPNDVPPDAPPDASTDEFSVEEPAADESSVKDPPNRADATSGDGPATTPAEETGTNDEDSSEDDVDRRTVRITDDVGAIFGVDQREYDLSTDDVVTLPAANADPLVERDAAEPLE